MEATLPGLLAKDATRKIAKAGENNGYDFFRPRDTRTGWEKFKDDIYNPREHTFLGRNRKKWGVFALFYLVFDTGLALLCAACGSVLMLTLDENRPTYTMESSLIGTNPGLGFRPVDYEAEAAQLSVIRFNSKNSSSVMKWSNAVDDFLKGYKDQKKLPNEGRNQQFCNHNTPPKPGRVCAFDVSTLGECRPGTNYGYGKSAPCIFIKLNKIFDWLPEYYDDPFDLPSDMPDDLKAKITKASPDERKAVWISCRGESKNDPNDIGTINYYPNQSLPGYYFPYVNHPEYLSPIIAVEFERPRTNKLLGIECRAWAKNIKYSSQRGEKAGAVRFDLFVENTEEDTKKDNNKTM